MTRSLDGLVYEPVPGFEDHLEKELSGGWTKYGPFYSKVWFNTPELAPAQPRQRLQNFGIKPDGIINFLSNEPPFRIRQRLGYRGACSAEAHFVPSGSAPCVFWRRNAWRKPFILEFDSISQAASALRDIQRNWAPSLFTRFRRGKLISEKLPPLSKKPRPFPWLPPDVPMGAWTLLDDNTILASAECESPFPGGVVTFEEDKQGPPSRAYLKLWEALTLTRRRPDPGDICLDAGASPGGWTWALAKLGARVSAVDRAPLAEQTAAMDGVRFIKHDAFTLKPEEIGKIDWLFCDAACYPSRLFEWIGKWLASGLCENYVCTIKMQGGPETADFDTPRRFAAIPGSRIVHLYHNKHELTYIRTGGPRTGEL